jgi:hypothetical protein
VAQTVLYDFAGTGAQNLSEFQVARQHLRVGTGRTLESVSREFFEQARAGEGQYYDVLSLRFPEAGSEAVALVRAYLIVHRRKKSLPFLVPDGEDLRDYTGRFRRFGHPGETLRGWHVLNFSGRGLGIPDIAVTEGQLPERPTGMPIEIWAWWALEEHILRPVRDRAIERYAACFTPGALEALAVLRQSRELNEGRLSDIYVSDLPNGSLRLLDIWDRRDPEQYRRRFGI